MKKGPKKTKKNIISETTNKIKTPRNKHWKNKQLSN